MNYDVAIKVEHVSKSFRLPHEKTTTIKNALVNFHKRSRGFEKQKVLQEVSFEIKKGEFFGIVGRNGSGKSTLLKLLAGIYVPDKGGIHIDGKLTPFIELGVGFNPELTGRENVFLNGALLGFNRKEMETMYDEIVAFAELERFMDQKLKNYSSGMQVRLAFSIAIRAKSDILLLDEVLAVGDSIFQKKCYKYFKQLKKEKKTVVFISHDTNALLEYCDRGILIDKGSVLYHDKIDTVVHQYIDLLNENESKLAVTQNTLNRWGTREVEIIQTSIKKSAKNSLLFTEQDDDISISVTFQAKAAVASPIFGLTIQDAAGERLFASNTKWNKVKTSDMRVGETVTVTWKIPNVFNDGEFDAAPAVSDTQGQATYDWIDNAASFKIRKEIMTNAYINAQHELTIKD